MPKLPAISQTDDHSVLRRSWESTSPKLPMVAWFGLIAVALIIWSAGLVWRSQRQLIVEQRVHVVVMRLLRVLSDLGDTEIREREYLLTGEPRYLEPYASSRKALEEEFNRLREMVKHDRKQREEVERLYDQVHQELTELQERIDLRGATALDAARASVLMRPGDQLADAAHQGINAMAAKEQIAMAGLSEESRSRLRTSLAALVGSGLLAGCCLLIGSAVLARGALQRKQAEEKMAKSDSRFQAVCEQAPLGIYETDAEGQCVYTNRQWSEISELSATESLGLGWKTVLHPDDGLKTSSGHGVAWESRLLNSRGEARWIRAVHGPVYSARGEVTGYVGTLEDVTERKLAEATLRESEERFRNMADTAPVLIWVSGPDKGCIFFNQAWLNFTGRTMEQELGDGWTNGVHPEDLDRCLTTFVASFDARRRFGMEYRLRRSDGEYRWLLDNGAPRFTRDDLFAGYIGSCIDITERKRAEEELRKFMSLADRSLDFVSMCDLELRPFYANAASLRLVGLDSLEAARRVEVQDLFFPEDQTFVTDEFFPAVLRDGHGEVEIRFRHFKTGDAIWMLFNVFSIHDSRGINVGWATVSINITERKQAERAVQQSRQELRALAGRLIDAEDAERKRIARELHDDLSQKLALLAIDAGSLVLAPPPSLEEMKQPLRNLQTRVVQLSQDVRRISHRLHPSILEDLGLTAALQDLCEEFSARDGIEVVFEQEVVPKALPVDVASCLYRVSQAALHNVIKHSRANQARLKVSGSPEGIQLRIHDTGVGFDSESTSVRNGLGIVSMKERVRLVQGEFSIHSQPGQGTTVEIFVPLSKEAI